MRLDILWGNLLIESIMRCRNNAAFVYKLAASKLSTAFLRCCAYLPVKLPWRSRRTFGCLGFETV